MGGLLDTAHARLQRGDERVMRSNVIHDKPTVTGEFDAVRCDRECSGPEAALQRCCDAWGEITPVG